MSNATMLPALSPANTSNKRLHLALWITQGLLAATFLMAGGMKLSAPIEQLQAQMPWVAGAMGQAVRLIGVAEVLGAIGLIVPAASRVLPRLTPLAAVGLLTVMVLASLTHLGRGEFAEIGVNVVLGAMSAFVAWGRTLRAPIAARAASAAAA